MTRSKKAVVPKLVPLRVPDVKLQRWRRGSINHMTYFLINFYCGMRLFTKNEEKRFHKERKVLKLNMDERTEEEDDTQVKEIPQGVARGRIQVKVVTAEEVSNQRPEKRQKIAEASDKD
ncbi:hypothetical protein AXG93_4541s1030 [Marchantia polymorpha subsp. ruderalis]|uniref:Uncharacterized protein n=1 Tax=Marchantia polymorpha subsp. ruderalis TaxID=1480154 RepID=A0A176VUG0_MARPO|nr:hypothetical protein AXG93_4541s1030 [Marchantia polymorpha subsp. ruderalis]